MSWGPATVFVHRRLNHDSSPYGPITFNVLPSDANTYVEDGESVHTNMTHSLYATLNEVNKNNNGKKAEYEDADIDGDDDDANSDDGKDDEEEDDEPDEDADEEPDEEDQEYDGDDNNEESPNDQEEDDVDEELYHPSPARLTKPPLSAHSTSTSDSNSPLNNKNQNQNQSNGSQQSTPSKRQPEAAAVAFNMLNSPQDTALLMRKRAGNMKSNPASAHVSPPTKRSMDEDEEE